MSKYRIREEVYSDFSTRYFVEKKERFFFWQRWTPAVDSYGYDSHISLGAAREFIKWLEGDKVKYYEVE